MGQVREVELTEADISAAMNETEKEIAGAAWGDEDTEALDASGDRSLESMGEGLEGQHEEDEGETEGEESEEESETEGDGEDGEDGEQPPAAAKKDGEEPPAKPQAKAEEPAGRVPPGRLREANERARAAEAERDHLRQQLESRSKDPEVEALKAQLATLTQLIQGQRQTTQAPPSVVKEEPKDAPDVFENPKGFVDYIVGQIKDQVGGVRQNLQEQSVNTSFRIAHVRHGAAFDEAWGAVNKLDPNNPDDRVTAQRIYNSADPGEALVAWHKRSVALQRVGDDPNAYEARIREETRQALMNDPEFKKQLIASLRSDAQAGDDGRPRTTTRLPTSVARASGSNVRTRTENFGAQDDSDQAVADAAWR